MKPDKLCVTPTYECGNGCRHCQIVNIPSISPRAAMETRYRVYDNALEYAAARSLPSLVIAGGEPISDAIGDVIHILERCAPWHRDGHGDRHLFITTNGRFANDLVTAERVIRRLWTAYKKGGGCDGGLYIQISFDSFHQEVVYSNGALKEKIPVENVANLMQIIVEQFPGAHINLITRFDCFSEYLWFTLREMLERRGYGIWEEAQSREMVSGRVIGPDGEYQTREFLSNMIFVIRRNGHGGGRRIDGETRHQYIGDWVNKVGWGSTLYPFELAIHDEDDFSTFMAQRSRRHLDLDGVGVDYQGRIAIEGSLFSNLWHIGDMDEGLEQVLARSAVDPLLVMLQGDPQALIYWTLETLPFYEPVIYSADRLHMAIYAILKSPSLRLFLTKRAIRAFADHGLISSGDVMALDASLTDEAISKELAVNFEKEFVQIGRLLPSFSRRQGEISSSPAAETLASSPVRRVSLEGPFAPWLPSVEDLEWCAGEAGAPIFYINARQPSAFLRALRSIDSFYYKQVIGCRGATFKSLHMQAMARRSGITVKELRARLGVPPETRCLITVNTLRGIESMLYRYYYQRVLMEEVFHVYEGDAAKRLPKPADDFEAYVQDYVIEAMNDLLQIMFYPVNHLDEFATSYNIGLSVPPVSVALVKEFRDGPGRNPNTQPRAILEAVNTAVQGDTQIPVGDGQRRLVEVLTSIYPRPEYGEGILRTYSAALLETEQLSQHIRRHGRFFRDFQWPPEASSPVTGPIEVARSILVHLRDTMDAYRDNRRRAALAELLLDVLNESVKVPTGVVETEPDRFLRLLRVCDLVCAYSWLRGLYDDQTLVVPASGLSVISSKYVPTIALEKLPLKRLWKLMLGVETRLCKPNLIQQTFDARNIADYARILSAVRTSHVTLHIQGVLPAMCPSVEGFRAYLTGISRLLSAGDRVLCTDRLNADYCLRWLIESGAFRQRSWVPQDERSRLGAFFDAVYYGPQNRDAWYGPLYMLVPDTAILLEKTTPAYRGHVSSPAAAQLPRGRESGVFGGTEHLRNCVDYLFFKRDYDRIALLPGMMLIEEAAQLPPGMDCFGYVRQFVREINVSSYNALLDALRERFDMVTEEEADSSSLAVYVNDSGIIVHIGLVSRPGFICSKFDDAHVYLHPSRIVPTWYGSPRFFRKKPDSVQPTNAFASSPLEKKRSLIPIVPGALVGMTGQGNGTPQPGPMLFVRRVEDKDKEVI